MQFQLKTCTPRAAGTVDGNITRTGGDIEHGQRPIQRLREVDHAAPGTSTRRRKAIQTRETPECQTVFDRIQSRIVHEFRRQVAFHLKTSVGSQRP
jgi:hypothetical protein